MNAPDDDPLADALRREMSAAAVPFDAGRADEMIHSASTGELLGARTWQAPLAAAAAVVVVGGGAALIGTHVGSGSGTAGADAAGCGPTAASSSAAPGSTAPVTREVSATPVSSSAVPSSTVAPSSTPVVNATGTASYVPPAPGTDYPGPPTISATRVIASPSRPGLHFALPTNSRGRMETVTAVPALGVASAEPCSDSVAPTSTSAASPVIETGHPNVVVNPEGTNAVPVVTLHATNGVRADGHLLFAPHSYRVDRITVVQTAGRAGVVQIGRWPVNEPLRPAPEPIATLRPATHEPDGVRRSINMGNGSSLSFRLRCPGTTACTVQVMVFGHTVYH